MPCLLGRSRLPGRSREIHARSHAASTSFAAIVGRMRSQATKPEHVCWCWSSKHGASVAKFDTVVPYAELKEAPRDPEVLFHDRYNYEEANK